MRFRYSPGYSPVTVQQCVGDGKRRPIRPAFKRFWQGYVAAIPGLLGGLWVLQAIHSSRSRAFLGAVLCVYAVWVLIQHGFRLTDRLER